MEVKFWERWLVRTGIVFLRRPDKKWEPQDTVKDFIMAFHYCSQYQEYRFDRFFDPLSHSSRFICGKCGAEGHTREGIGIFFFQIIECFRIVDSVCKDKSRFKWWNNLKRRMMFNRLMVFGFGKYLPEDRGGKTAGELEWEMLNSFFSFLTSGFFKI